MEIRSSKRPCGVCFGGASRIVSQPCANPIGASRLGSRVEVAKKNLNRACGAHASYLSLSRQLASATNRRWSRVLLLPVQPSPLSLFL